MFKPNFSFAAALFKRVLSLMSLMLWVSTISFSQEAKSSVEDKNVFVIDTVNASMEFTIKEFRVKAGEEVSIILVNSDQTQPHNLAVCKPGTGDIVGHATLQLMTNPEKALAKNYIPDNPNVMHWIKLLQPGEISHITFNAPDKAGEYPYICTYAGHWVMMKGVMFVE